MYRIPNLFCYRQKFVYFGLTLTHNKISCSFLRYMKDEGCHIERRLVFDVICFVNVDTLVRPQNTQYRKWMKNNTHQPESQYMNKA